jgi:hypothetical protein
VLGGGVFLSMQIALVLFIFLNMRFSATAVHALQEAGGLLRSYQTEK